MVGLPRYRRRGPVVPRVALTGRPSVAFDDDIYEDDTPFDYSGLEVVDEVGSRYEETGVLGPDGEPIYREVGAPLGFPIIPQE